MRKRVALFLVKVVGNVVEIVVGGDGHLSILLSCFSKLTKQMFI